MIKTFNNVCSNISRATSHPHWFSDLACAKSLWEFPFTEISVFTIWHINTFGVMPFITEVTADHHQCILGFIAFNQRSQPLKWCQGRRAGLGSFRLVLYEYYKDITILEAKGLRKYSFEEKVLHCY